MKQIEKHLMHGKCSVHIIIIIIIMEETDNFIINHKKNMTFILYV